ncbi:MAG: mandelate racemase/muconate lactonizing enzyme family protein [Fimbriimonadaceae bacterium]|nr:mandelate racemase/muconate lactonizing enzyme family protein [Fimbriimonadaceae bacterium]
MHLRSLTTVQLPALHRLAFVRVETFDGVVGWGETYDKAATSIAAIHEIVAPLVLGRRLGDISGLSHLVRDQIQFHGRAGGEMRGWSAVEMALWDALGQATGQPLYQLLGGRCRESVPVYNTCVSHGAYRDHERFLGDPGDLATELLADGYTAAKIWPFDRASERHLGQRVEPRDLDRAVAPVAAMRATGLEVGIELHGRWTLPAAVAVAHALEPHTPLFLEEALPAGHPNQIRALREATRIPLIGSEWLINRQDVLPWLQCGATQILMTDTSWNGGLLESLRIASLAETFGVPLVFHSCGGPLTHAASLHLATAIPNIYAVETVRAFAQTWFREVSDLELRVRDGLTAPPPERPGLGLSLADLRHWPGAEVREAVSATVQDSSRYSVGDCWDDDAWAGSDPGQET